MAEQLTMRQVVLDDGTTLSFQGTELRVLPQGTSEPVVAQVGAADVPALLWLLSGRRSRRGDGDTPTRRSQRQKGNGES
jgi:hypothetical protein